MEMDIGDSVVEEVLMVCRRPVAVSQADSGLEPYRFWKLNE